MISQRIVNAVPMAMRTPASHFVKRSLCHQVPNAFASAVTRPYINGEAMWMGAMAKQDYRGFSTSVKKQEAPESEHMGTVVKTLGALDMAVVRQIKADLISVDANFDGRQVAL